MTKPIAIILCLALAGCMRAEAPGDASARESVTADVARSEWTPPGVVSVDVRSGRYLLTPAPARGEPVRPPERRGTLAAAELAPLRAAFAAALSQGLVEPACAAGRDPPQIVISTSGTPALVLTSAAGTISAPSRLGCWSEAARGLLSVLEARFRAEARGRR